MLKRIFTFLALNFVIVLTISLILQLFHVGPYLTHYGIDYKSLALFCSIWGMAGAMISLLLSRKMAKWMLRVKLIQSGHCSHQEQMIYDMVAQLSQRARLPDIPEVGIFNSNQPNAFATGPSKKRSLVAVSKGLIETLPKNEIEAVIGHEISHIANGDMVTMTLLQGVVNAFVMFLARVIAFAVSGIGRERQGRSSGSYMSYMLCTFLFEMIFMILGSIIVARFSRWREFRADRGSAELLGKEPMINALRSLERHQAGQDVSSMAKQSQSVAALMIAKPRSKNKMFQLFTSHPPLETRIARLNELP